MKKILLFLLTFPFVFACSKNEPEVKEIIHVNKIEAVIPPADNFDYDTLKGMYQGDFGGSNIRIILNYVSSSNVIGYNIHKGLQRNLNGKVSRSNDTVTMLLNEPGDHKYDGVFTLTFVGEDKAPSGIWEHKDGKFKKQTFKLEKMIAPEKSDDDEITEYNISRWFGEIYDSIGSYHFSNDGLVRYEYYPKKDYKTRIEQLVEIKGSWNMVDSTVTIDWQPNKLFKSKQTQYTVSKTEWGEPCLRGTDGVELYPYFW